MNVSKRQELRKEPSSAHAKRKKNFQLEKLNSFILSEYHFVVFLLHFLHNHWQLLSSIKSFMNGDGSSF